MKEDLTAPYPCFGFGVDAFDGYVSYRCLDENALAREIADMRVLIEATAASLTITQDLGLGMMLWLSHFFREEIGLWCNDGAAWPYSIGYGVKTDIFAASPIGQVRLHQLRRLGRLASCRSNT
jgi:hypothetical protein